ncbi:MAG: glycosyltransferase family 2 protein [Clostridiales bacterium]|nr:glycosyltransferase family 2 protein [Clostridiales bacterium]
MPKLSVIIPAYNARAYIGRCLDSVLAQTFADFEVIAIDDGSTDDTAGIITSYAEKDERVRLLRRENGGVSAARNSGLEKARGELIAFADADDWLEPDTYEILVGELLRTGASTAACADMKIYDGGRTQPEAAPLPEGFYTKEEVALKLVLPLLQDRLSENPVNGYVFRFVYDRKVIERARLRFEGAYLEDEVFLIEYLLEGGSLVCVDRPLYNYYQNMSSATRRYMKDYTETFLSSFNRKKDIVRKYSPPVSEGWENNTCWAGLLIAVSNECAPGNPAPFSVKLKRIREICAVPEFAQAVRELKPSGMSRGKTVVAAMIRRRLFLPLALMYEVKYSSRKQKDD